MQNQNDPSRFVSNRTEAVLLPVSEVPRAAVHQLPSHLRVIPALGSDLLVGILQVKVGRVTILVHGVGPHIFLAVLRVVNAVPGCHVLPTQVVVGFPIPVTTSVGGVT